MSSIPDRRYLSRFMAKIGRGVEDVVYRTEAIACHTGITYDIE
jgi:hypothetical protein